MENVMKRPVYGGFKGCIKGPGIGRDNARSIG